MSLVHDAQVMLLQSGWLSGIVWVLLAFMAHGMWRSCIGQYDPIEIWNGNYEMRGRQQVRIGWGIPLDDKEGE